MGKMPLEIYFLTLFSQVAQSIEPTESYLVKNI